MSKTVDERVVEMRFDNANFERNVQNTMSTLDKLKEKLNLTGASKGLENVDAAANKVNMSGLSNAVDTVCNKFSALEVMSITALANITNSAVNAGKQLVKSLSIDQITAGFDKFGKKTTSVATLQAQGFAIEEVNEQLDRLNWFTDETSYNYTDMVENISKFTATGKGLTESVNAMEGIATWAALSGQNAQKASSAMYQLSQALGAGVMRKEDYKSIQNVSMDTDEFRQKALDAAVALGTLKKNSDGTYKSLKATGAGAEKFTKSQFAESLTEGKWFTSDVMMKVFGEYSKAVDEIYKVTEEKGMLASEVIDEIHDKAEKEGISTNEAIKALGYNFDEFALKAFESAQKARTFTDAIDATKDAVSTGWLKTFEIIFGNAEEATELWTNLANSLWDVFAAGGESRNELLESWKELGGRDALIESFWNSWEAIAGILGPIKDAFRDIFPPTTAEQLYKFTNKLKELTGDFKAFTEKHGPKIRSTFKGIFAVIDLVISAVGKVAGGILKVTGSILGFTGGILSGTASLGEWLSNIRDSIKEANLLGKAIDKLVYFLQTCVGAIKNVGSSIKESFKVEGYEGFFGFIKALWKFLKDIGVSIGKAFGNIGKSISKTFLKDIIGENTLSDLINTGTFSAVMIGIYKLINNLSKPLDSMAEMFDKIGGKNGILTGVTKILDEVRGCFEAYQENLKAGTLLKIAGAIGILAASLFVISTIDSEKLGKSLAAITVLLAELLIGMEMFSKISGIKGAFKMSTLMLSMSTSLLILSAAMKVIGSMNMTQMLTGLSGIAGGLAALVGALHLLPEQNVRKASKSIRTLSISLLILSGALKVMGSMTWSEMGRGLAGVTGGLLAMVAAVNLLPKDSGSRTLGMVGLATALVILGAALKTMGSMSWIEIGRGLTVLAGSLAAILVAIKLMPKNMVTMGIGLIGVATALVILGSALNNMGSMSWGEIGKGLTVLGGALLILSLGLLAMKSCLSGAAALLVATIALTALVVPLKILGGMSWTAIIKSLVALAGAFTVIGVAGALLTPLIPSILALAGAFALIGISVVAVGAGLALVGTGITILASSLALGATAIIAGLNVIIIGLIDLIPSIILKIGEAIKSFCKVIGDCAPAIADSLLKLVSEILKSLAEYTPIIANSLFDLLIGVLDVLSARLPELIVAAINVIKSFFAGVAEGLKGFDGANLLKGVIAVGLMSGLVVVLSSVASMVPMAMVGLLGVGALIAELALILAAIGGLSQIPGLSWLIEQGGQLLEKVGIAIGQFVGGFIGGIAQGFTSSLPAIATDLSNFMTNIQPFIEGAKNINSSLLTGIGNLVGAMMLITGGSLVNSIVSFLTGKNSFADFGKQLVPFGKSMKDYGDAVADVDANAILASADAAKALSEVANAIPSSGGLFSGKKDLEEFGKNLKPLGKGLKEFSQETSGIVPENVIAASSAAKALGEMANVIPNEGGMVAWFTGDNSLAKFAKHLKPLGTGLKEFSQETSGIVPENITACSNAAKTLAEMMATIPNEGGMVAWFTGDNSVSKFAWNLKPLGTGLKEFSQETSGIVPENIVACSNAAKTLAEMMSVIPNQGGMVAWFTGDNSVATFASNLKPLGTGLKDFSNETAEIVPENVVAASNAAKALAEMANTIPNEGGMVAWFTGDNSVSKFASNLKPLGTGLKDFSNETAEIVPENIVAAANAAKALAEMVSVIPNEGGMKSWFVGDSSIATFADKLPDLGEGLKGFSDSVAGISPENVTSAATAGKTLAEMADTIPKKTDRILTFGDNLSKFGEKLKSYFDKLVDTNTDTIKASTEAIKAIQTATSSLNADTMASAATSITDLTKALKEMSNISESSVTGFSDAMKKLGETNVDSVIKAFDEAGPKLNTAGSTAIEKLTEGIKSQEPNVKTALDTLLSTISDCEADIKGYQSSFYDAGSYLVTGFCNGISSNSYKASLKAKAMAATAKYAAEQALGINSPSKVFYKIGSFTVEGFVNALNNTKQVFKAGVGIAESAKNGISNAISKVTELLNNSTDSEPVIKPVLDLSDVESGASTIGGFFDNIGVGANLTAISSSMNARSQNGVNGDIVSAINKLRKDLGNVGGTTNNYNVNGITYDDDSSIKDAVGTLVRAVKMERRA